MCKIYGFTQPMAMGNAEELIDPMILDFEPPMGSHTDVHYMYHMSGSAGCDALNNYSEQ